MAQPEHCLGHSQRGTLSWLPSLCFQHNRLASGGKTGGHPPAVASPLLSSIWVAQQQMPLS
ncbi:MAG: hypothetical protein ACUVRV_09565 [Cyanobacteriota bacterium]